MKINTLFIAALALLLTTFSASFAQEKAKTVTITVTFKNNSILPHKYTFVTYEPNTDGNGTTGVMMGPNGTREFKVPAGTKFYLADSKQVDVVMSGNKLTGAPFYVAKIEDNGKVISLRK